MQSKSPFNAPLLLFGVQDGGLLINNPTALAVHESKCLWPNAPLECVVSVGTGRVENLGKNSATSTSLKTKLTHVISSATDTEGESRVGSAADRGFFSDVTEDKQNAQRLESALFCPSCEQELGFDVASVENAAPRLDFVVIRPTVGLCSGCSLLLITSGHGHLC